MLSVVIASLFVAFLWGLNPIISKYILRDVEPDITLGIGAVIHLLLALIYAVGNNDSWSASLAKSNFTPKTVSLLLVSGIVAFIPYLIFLRLLNKNDANIVTALTYVSPFFTAILAYYILKERFTVYSVTGIVMIVVGIILISLHTMKHTI